MAEEVQPDGPSTTTNLETQLAQQLPPPPPPPPEAPSPATADAPAVQVPSYPACDRCHSRKIRCDRQAQCQHCIESGSLCQRTRSVIAGKRQRRSKSKPVAEVLRLEDRLARLEKSITHGESPHIPSDSYSQRSPSDRDRASSADQPPIKRARSSTAQVTPKNVKARPTASQALHGVASESSNLFSSTGAEAQSTIQQALRNASYLSESGQATLSSALSTIRNMLRGHEQDSSGRLIEEAQTNSSVADLDLLPQPELVHEVLLDQQKTAELFQWFPMVSQKSFVAMYQALWQLPSEKRDIRQLMCVSETFAWFLCDRTFHSNHTKHKTGLEIYLQQRANDYSQIVSFGSKQLLTLSPPSILSIQALVCAAFRFQDNGDQSGAWTLIAAACHMCGALGLDTRTYKNTPEDDELRWCFLTTYMLDQGIAMNLARTPTLHDSNIDPAIFVRREYEMVHIQFECHYLTLDFARVQSLIHTNLKSPQSRRASTSVRYESLQAIKKQLDQIYEKTLILKERIKPMNKPDISAQVVVMEFSYWNILTVMYRSDPVFPEEPFLNEECLQAARSTLRLIKPLRNEVSDWQSHVAIAHWSLFYFPFTPFFVLFCNVIFQSETEDLALMNDMTEYLKEVRHSNTIAAKLYALCTTFCDLATTILDMEIKRKHQVFQQASQSGYVNNNYTNPRDPNPVNMGQSSYANQQLPIPMMQEHPFNGQGNEGQWSQTQDQADVLWQLLLSDPTPQWLETDFSGIMPMTT